MHALSREEAGSRSLEHGIYRLAGVDPTKEQSWVRYTLAVLWFHLIGIAALYGLQRIQNVLPLNPQGLDAVAPDLALNTASSAWSPIRSPLSASASCPTTC